MSGRPGLPSWLSSPPPSVALEIGARRVTAVALGTVSGRLTVTAHATERLPDGAVVPGLTTPNVVERDTVVAAAGRALAALGTRATRVALVIPDGAAKVSLVRFDTLPERAADLDQLVRWQVKKAVPFPLEQAQVAWTPGARDTSGVELVVTIARRDIVAEYEQVCEAVGVHPGLVDLATVNLVNLVLAGDAATQGPAGDWLLVHVSPDSSTMAIVRGAALVLFRHRPTEGEGEGSLADLVHQTTMYYEDRLGGQALGRIVVAPRDLDEPQARELALLVRTLEARAGLRVQDVDLRTAAGVSDRISPAPELLHALAAPVGALIRERVA